MLLILRRLARNLVVALTNTRLMLFFGPVRAIPLDATRVSRAKALAVGLSKQLPDVYWLRQFQSFGLDVQHRTPTLPGCPSEMATAYRPGWRRPSKASNTHGLARPACNLVPKLRLLFPFTT